MGGSAEPFVQNGSSDSSGIPVAWYFPLRPIFESDAAWCQEILHRLFLLAPTGKCPLPETAICMFPCRRQVQRVLRAKCGATHFEAMLLSFAVEQKRLKLMALTASALR